MVDFPNAHLGNGTGVIRGTGEPRRRFCHYNVRILIRRLIKSTMYALHMRLVHLLKDQKQLSHRSLSRCYSKNFLFPNKYNLHCILQTPSFSNEYEFVLSFYFSSKTQHFECLHLLLQLSRVYFHLVPYLH
jgi:hypothetical protein